jgi:hypothetical protein
MVGLGYIITDFGLQLILLCQGQTLSSPGEFGSDSSCVLLTFPQTHENLQRQAAMTVFCTHSPRCRGGD